MPFIFIPFFIHLKKLKALKHKLREALWLQLFCSLFVYEWMLSAAEILWNKSFLSVLAIYILVVPLVVTYITLWTIAEHYLAPVFKEKSDLLRSCFLACLFPLLELPTSYMYHSFGKHLAGAPELLSFARFGGIPLIVFLMIFHMEIVAAAWVRDRRRAVVTSATYLFLFCGLSYVLTNLVPLTQRSSGLPINIIQTNAPIEDTLDGMKLPHLRTYRGSLRAIALIKDARIQHPKAKLTILPETVFPIDFFSTNNPDIIRIREMVENEARQTGGDFIFGTLTVNESALENSVVHLRFEEGKALYQKFPKRYLMPFAETIPGSRHFPWLEKVFFKDTLLAGPFEPISITVDRTVFGIVICNEIFHPGVFSLHKKADVMIHLGNETWVSGTSGQGIIISEAVARSIENSQPILKVSNTGISVFIDQRGHLESLAPRGQEKITQLSMKHISSGETFYVRHGVKKVYVFFGVTILFLGVFAFWRRRKELGEKRGQISPRE